MLGFACGVAVPGRWTPDRVAARNVVSGRLESSRKRRATAAAAAAVVVAATGDKNGGENKWDDAALNSALRAKVRELYGPSSGRPDAVLREKVEKIRREQREQNAARTVVASVIAVSVISAILFTALYYNGSIHGASKERPQYMAPTYGTESYIDPEELLELDSRTMTPFQFGTDAIDRK
mmetsp:Transcript_10659/g.28479  ORF Transcript_10659/g.28479 Transcript_10659/m.28479 type:complete len:180 (+) Transcript_10659:64-603(+)|eukprot:CAMPEP_0185833262 /NCGR_PEP_ID=MMETSP1353-20130828/2568_1 /TAXON_ID=1077150 /ORGANISM="Erythrolobus australicus, Strain CCMP3124" /LENGTH=179 /DNA_ID=CAMNT_0028531521 /DNA_START=64 /DNA_END=603 /DNA_ORIENTATION=-